MDRQRKRSRNAVDTWGDDRTSRSRGDLWSAAPSRSRSPSRSHSGTHSRSRSRSRSPRHRKARKASKRHKRHKRLSPEVDSSGRGEYSSSSRRSKKYKTKPIATSATPTLREQAGDEDEEDSIRRDMEHHARHVWRDWCEGGRFSDGHLVTLEKVIEFIDTEVLPKEEDILRQRMERTIAPVSGIESKILPVLQLWRRQESRNYGKHTTSHHRQHKACSASISPIQEPQVRAPQLYPETTAMPGASAEIPANNFLSSASAKSNTDVMPMTIVLDSDEEVVTGSGQDHPTPYSVNGRETTPEDLEFLRNSLAKAHEISRLVASLCGDLETKASMDSAQFPTGIFSRLQSAQQQARNMGLEAIFYEPLLLKVLEEHMRIVHDLNVKVGCNDIILVSRSTDPATASHAAEGTLDPSRMKAVSPSAQSVVKEDLVPPKTGDQGDVCDDNDNMEWDADKGPAEAVPCPKSMSAGRSVLAGLDNGPDDVPEMELFNKASEEEGTAEDCEVSAFKHEMDRGDKSIRHIWQQWTVGVNGNPPIQKLEEQYGTRWRMPKDVNYLNQSRCIVREIARLITEEGQTEDQAIQLLQNQLGSRAIGTFALQLFRENTGRRKGKPPVPRRSTSSMVKTKDSSPSLEAPPVSEAQTPAEIWEELVRNSRHTDLKFFTPSPSSVKRHKGTTVKSPTRLKESSGTSSSQAAPATGTPSASTLPNTTVAATIPANTALKASGLESTPSSTLGPSKDPIAHTPKPTTTAASVSVTGISLAAPSPLNQLPATPAPPVATRSFKTAVEEAFREETAVGNSTLAQTAPTLDSSRLPARESAMPQNTVTIPATTQTVGNTPAGTMQAPSQSPTQVSHSTHPRTRAGGQAQTTPSRPPSTTKPTTAMPSNNALALVYANALLTRFMATSMPQDVGSSNRAITGDQGAATVTTVTAGTAAMTLASSTSPDHSQRSNATAPTLTLAPTTSTPASTLTLAPVSAPGSTPVPVLGSTQAPAPAPTGISTVVPTVRTRSSSRKASNSASVQTSETHSNGSMSPASTSTALVPTTAPTTASTATPTSAPATATATAPTAGGTAVPSSSQFQYRMNKNNSTVFDIWAEWMEGINGGPSISSMNRRYGDLSWLPVEERELYRDQRMVLVEAEKLVRLRGMQVKQALEELERKRVSLNVDIKVFGKVLAENKAP